MCRREVEGHKMTRNNAKNQNLPWLTNTKIESKPGNIRNTATSHHECLFLFLLPCNKIHQNPFKNRDFFRGRSTHLVQLVLLPSELASVPQWSPWMVPNGNPMYFHLEDFGVKSKVSTRFALIYFSQYVSHFTHFELEMAFAFSFSSWMIALPTASQDKIDPSETKRSSKTACKLPKIYHASKRFLYFSLVGPSNKWLCTRKTLERHVTSRNDLLQHPVGPEFAWPANGFARLQLCG